MLVEMSDKDKKDLEGLVVEDLVGSTFKSGEHEAYAFTMDQYSISSFNEAGRIGSFFHSMLACLDWDYIEATVQSVQAEIEKATPVGLMIEVIEFHFNQILAATKTVKLSDIKGFGSLHVASNLVEIAENGIDAINKLRTSVEKSEGEKS